MPNKELITLRDINNIKKYLDDSYEYLRLLMNTIDDINLKYADAVKINKSLERIRSSLNMINNLLPYTSSLVNLEDALREGIKNAK